MGQLWGHDWEPLGQLLDNSGVTECPLPQPASTRPPASQRRVVTPTSLGTALADAVSPNTIKEHMRDVLRCQPPTKLQQQRDDFAERRGERQGPLAPQQPAKKNSDPRQMQGIAAPPRLNGWEALAGKLHISTEQPADPADAVGGTANMHAMVLSQRFRTIIVPPPWVAKVWPKSGRIRKTSRSLPG